MEISNSQLFTFIVATLLLTIAPGVDTFIVIRNVLRGGWLDGVFTSLGICTGLFFHATLSACGLSIILIHSAFLFNSVKTVGALYLVWLGIITIYNATKNHKTIEFTQHHSSFKPVEFVKSFREGILSNVLNPKPAVFYMAFLPQFIGPADSVFVKSMLLTSIQFAIGIVWLVILSFTIFKIKRYLTTGPTRRILNTISGSVLIAFGIKLGIQGTK